MAASYMIRKHIRSVEISRTPDAKADRNVSMEAAKRANEERLKRFKLLTQDNFQDASDFFNRRFEYWKRNLAT